MWVWQVVYDLSKGEEELATISPWLLNIQARAPSSPILVVGTHRDMIGKLDHVICYLPISSTLISWKVFGC